MFQSASMQPFLIKFIKINPLALKQRPIKIKFQIMRFSVNKKLKLPGPFFKLPSLQRAAHTWATDHHLVALLSSPLPEDQAATAR